MSPLVGVSEDLFWVFGALLMRFLNVERKSFLLPPIERFLSDHPTSLVWLLRSLSETGSLDEPPFNLGVRRQLVILQPQAKH